jgi:hypothetical protein
MNLPEEQRPFKEPSSPIGRMQSILSASLVTPSPKKNNKSGGGFIDEKPFINERKLSSTRVEKNNLNNGEHTLIPVTAKMIHSAVFECKWLVLKDGQPLDMIKIVGAVRCFSMNIKIVIIYVEDGTGLVRVILWWKEHACTTARWLIHKCKGNGYIHVIGEVKDYYGVHKVIAFDV